MCSRFDTGFLAAFGTLLKELGQEITYTPKGGEESSVYGIFNELSSDYTQEPDAIFSLRRAEIKVACADVSSPTNGDAFSVDGVVWTVAYITSSAGDVFTIVCTRPEERRKTRAGEVLWR